MSELLTPEKRAELRALIAKSELADDEVVIAHALLDAVEERDRMRAEVDDLRDCYQSAHDPKSVGNIAWLAERFREGMDLAKAENAKLREQVAKLREALEPFAMQSDAIFPYATQEDMQHAAEVLVATAPKEATS